MSIAASRWKRIGTAVVGAWALMAGTAGSTPAAAADTTVEGTLLVRWSDPMPGARAAKEGPEFRLATADGKSFVLDVPAAAQTRAFTAFGQRVAVRGRTSETAQAEPMRVGGRPAPVRLAVDELTSLEPETAQAEAGGAAGPEAPTAAATKRLLVVLLRYKDEIHDPHAPSFYSALINPSTGNSTLAIPATVNGYYDKVAWGRIGFKADIAGKGGLGAPKGWFLLPHSRSTYGTDIDAIADDGMALVKAAGIDASVYDSLSFVTSNDFSGSAKGGNYAFGGKTFGATWIPPWAQEAETYVHELGHSLGLPHSGWVYEAYDSPWDDMSVGSAAKEVACGWYYSAQHARAKTTIYCKEPGAGFITMHKAYKGWLPPANIQFISGKAQSVVVLEANALPLGATKKMVKICLAGYDCTGAKARYFTVEARIRAAQYEKGLPGEGVIIHDINMDRSPIGATNACFYNSESGWAVPIDATPNDWDAHYCDAGGRVKPNYGLYNAQFGVGKTFTSVSKGIKVEVLSRTTTTFTVRVTRSL